MIFIDEQRYRIGNSSSSSCAESTRHNKTTTTSETDSESSRDNVKINSTDPADPADPADSAESCVCSRFLINSKEESRFDPSGSVPFVGCPNCRHKRNKSQIIQGIILYHDFGTNRRYILVIYFSGDPTAMPNIPTVKTDKKITDVSLDYKIKEDKREEDKEKEKHLERLRYLETRVADLEEANMCSICMERRRNVAFLCGHGACEHCAAPLKTCHMCRKTITKKINLY